MKVKLSPLYEFKPTAKELIHAQQSAKTFLRHSKIEKLQARYDGYQVEDTSSDISSVLISDFSEIPFLDNFLGIQYYQYRLRILAGNDDIMCGTFPLDPFLEKYDREYLDIGHPEYIPIQERKYKSFLFPEKITAHKDSFDRLISGIQKKDVQYIHPYMGVHDVWELGLDLSKHLGRKLKVLGPLPYVCKWVNDKSYFTHFVRLILGPDDVVTTKWSTHLSATCGALRELAKLYPKVALKIADYASALGNILYDSQELSKLSDQELKERVLKDLEDHGWTEGHTVCIVQWRHDMLSSPSSQVWIPSIKEGPPIIEGIFEQFLEGEKKIFKGSRPSTLPKYINDAVAKKTFLLSLFFQYLGYVGRCSFDLIISGTDYDDCDVQLVECNGRWGGTSLPMSFVNRLFGNHHDICYKALDIAHPKLKGIPFEKFLAVFKENEAFQKKKKKGHFIFYNTACLEPTSKFDVIALGKDYEETHRRTDVELIDIIKKRL